MAASLYSAQQLVWMRGLPNTETLDGMRFVGASTGPTDPVLDGFSGLAWFRPHAFRYWFLHPGVRARLSPADVASVLTLVDACATRPRVVILDDHLRALSPDLAPAVTRFYRPSDMANIWVRDDSKTCATAGSVATAPLVNAIH